MTEEQLIGCGGCDFSMLALFIWVGLMTCMVMITAAIITAVGGQP